MEIEDLLKVVTELSQYSYPSSSDEEKTRKEIVREALKKIKSKMKGG